MERFEASILQTGSEGRASIRGYSARGGPGIEAVLTATLSAAGLLCRRFGGDVQQAKRQEQTKKVASGRAGTYRRQGIVIPHGRPKSIVPRQEPSKRPRIPHSAHERLTLAKAALGLLLSSESLASELTEQNILKHRTMAFEGQGVQGLQESGPSRRQGIFCHGNSDCG